jgi:hypothetical protein
MKRLELARAVADAVTALPQVRGLAAGPGVEIVTLGPQGRVLGVQGDAERVQVAIVAAELPLAPVVAAVAAAAAKVLRAQGDGRRVDVYVTDVSTSALRRLSTPAQSGAGGGLGPLDQPGAHQGPSDPVGFGMAHSGPAAVA